MANILKVHQQEAIRQLARQGWGIRRISRELRLSRVTVRRYLRGWRRIEEPSDRPGDSQIDPLSTPGSGSEAVETDPLSTPGKSGRNSLCTAHRDLIAGKLEDGLSAQRIFQDLRAQTDFCGSYQAVKRFVRKLRQIDPKLVQRVEVAPGEEIQVDFGSGPMLLGSEGKRAKTWIFRVILSHSRKAYSEAVRRQDTETFLRCLENAFRSFGGVTLTINLDNLKAAVLKADWADPQLNPKLVDFAKHYQTAIFPCLPRTPEHKGKVENSVKYVKSNALAGRKFPSLSALNQFLRHWERTVADLRIHGTTKRQVLQHFAAEKPLLKPLPPSLFPYFQEGRRTVHRDGYVEVQKAFYHAPPEFVGRHLWVRYDSRLVRLFSQDKYGILTQVQVHRRLEAGKFTNAVGIGGGHATLQANLDYWLGRACELGSDCETWARSLVHQRGITAIRTLMGLVNLSEDHSFPALNRACQQAQKHGQQRLCHLKNLLQNPSAPTQLTFAEHHPLIRNLSEYGVFVHNKNQSQDHE